MKLNKIIDKLDHSFHPKWIAVLRIIVGLALFAKGILFIYNKSLISQLTVTSTFLKGNEWLQTFIPWMHLLGGVFIVIGLFTRLAALVQLPILVGAITFVNATKGVYAGQSELLLAIILLSFLIVFLLEGGGPLSWDQFIRKQRENLVKQKQKSMV